MSSFVYHAVPRNFQGTTIYPLNQLKNVYPTIYTERVKAYSWRPEVMEQPVHPLNCFWNDCIFLTATPPQLVKQELYKIDPGHQFPSKFWKIDAHTLEPQNTTIYNFATNVRPHPAQDFLPYNPGNLEEYTQVPSRTIEYWQQCIYEGRKRMLLYLYIPHIMYKGTINTRELEIVEV